MPPQGLPRFNMDDLLLQALQSEMGLVPGDTAFAPYERNYQMQGGSNMPQVQSLPGGGGYVDESGGLLGQEILQLPGPAPRSPRDFIRRAEGDFSPRVDPVQMPEVDEDLLELLQHLEGSESWASNQNNGLLYG